MKKLLAYIFLLSIITFSVIADIGPKPTADIHVTLQSSELNDVFYAKMLTCHNNTPEIRDLIPQLDISIYDGTAGCYWKPDWGAWGGKCTASACHFGYIPPTEFKLAVYLPSTDKVYISNLVKRENFYSTFEANLINNGGMDIEETTGFWKSDIIRNFKYFLLALFLTIVLESLIAWERVRKQKNPRRIMYSVVVANLISLPIVWFVFPLLVFAPFAVIMGEFFAFAFEGIFIHYANKDYSLSDTMILSLIMNAVSLFIGGMVFIVIGLFILRF
jgi:hypothetical protein